MNKNFGWKFPLKKCNGIPINYHPGAFGFRRKKDFHTGVDLYTNDGELVYAVEDGIVVNIDIFTGKKLGHDWWEETWAVMIEGSTGVVNYGELTPESNLKVGHKVHCGQFIGYVKRVLFEHKLRTDIPGHSTSMLHLELYKHGNRDFVCWHDQKPHSLLDPTQYLLFVEEANQNILTL
jgi:murein DD-endopeptidase MepM/ murein hydrolase activator NlpD